MPKTPSAVYFSPMVNLSQPRRMGTVGITHATIIEGKAMSRLIEIAGIAGFFLAAVLPAQALPIYTTADFSGGITNVTKHGDELGLQRTKSCPECPEGFVGGHLT